jgi:hypothetical protein
MKLGIYIMAHEPISMRYSIDLPQFKFKFHGDRRSVGQFALVSGSHLELRPDFSFLSDSCGFLMLSTLSDERMGL